MCQIFFNENGRRNKGVIKSYFGQDPYMVIESNREKFIKKSPITQT
jgi:hypothetical protein